MKNKRSILMMIMIVLLTGCGKEPTMTQKISPIIDNNGADPWIWQEAEDYYYIKTTGDNLTLWRSQNLSDVAAGEQKVVWEMPENFESIWAPELHRIDGTWYIYFAANQPKETHRMYALVNQQADPYEGEWQLTEIKGMDDKFAIDGTVLTYQDKDYFIWSGWEGYENVVQNLYLAEMLSPTEIKSEKILISKPEYEWETRQQPLINEGPQVIIKGEQINLVYSASGSWDNDYCLGLLTANGSQDLTDPASWHKHPEPVFQQGNGVYGPGHNGFATSKDGQEDWLIFHAARWDHSGWHRSIRIQKFGWHQDGTPDFGTPLASEKKEQQPSGEASRYVYDSQQGRLTGDLLLEQDASLQKKVVKGFESREDQLSFSLQVPAGDYTLFAYVKTADHTDPENIPGMEISTTTDQVTLPVYPSEYYQPLVTKLTLKDQDTLTFKAESGVDTLLVDRIELLPEKGK